MFDDHFPIALGDVTSPYAAFKPPKRVSVSEGATENLVIKQPGGYVGNWSADETPYMVEPMNMLASRRHEALCFVGPARTGKCLDVDTPIPTPSGWKRMGDLMEGDLVFGPDGNPTRVLKAHAVKLDLPCYRVEFSDGTSLVADSEHLWGVERHYDTFPNWRYEVVSTIAMTRDLMYSGNRFRYRVRLSAPIRTQEVDLPIDPYVLGVWLGDGASNRAVISSHNEDAGHYVRAFEHAGHKVEVLVDRGDVRRLVVDRRDRLTTHCQRGHEFELVGQASNGGCMECLRLGHHRRKHGKDPGPLSMFSDTLASRLRRLGLMGDKHIPEQYLRASIEQRMKLLQGLMDTDGHCDVRGSTVEFSSANERLVVGFLELARSLGLKPIAKQKVTTWVYRGERKYGKAWRVNFPVPAGFEPFTLPRKADRCTWATIDTGFKQIVSITPVESRPVRCILVDNESHLFLAGDGMTPTHNTMGLLDGWMAHVVVNDPGDMLIVQMTQDKAREFSKVRVDRAIRYSPHLRSMMSASSQDDNTHDKRFKHGMWLRIAWPTVSNLSGSDYRYVAVTDMDRMPDDIDGEGSVFSLALKRTQTYLSRGMCMVESSPGRELTDPNWLAVTPHEAPPTSGILGVYNRGDRRRWYWPCPHCNEFFEAKPGLELFNLPPDDQLLEIVREADLGELASQYNQIFCPHCGAGIGTKEKHGMNRLGRWLADGQTITADGVISGTAPDSSIASYWLGGVAAAYQSWRSLLMRYFQGLREYALTGSELTLQTTVNTDQGMPYMSRHLVEASRTSNNPADRVEGELERYVVPDETRFLVAAVDVQGGTNARFIVQVHAIGPHMEQWLVDRYALTESEREGMGGKAPLDPAAYVEDWNLLTEKVVRSTYRTSREGTELRVKMTVVDSGGEDGVTDKAYAWYRSLRRQGLHQRVMLVKGASTKNAPLIRESWVGGKKAKEKGDIPLYLLNVNQLKDGVSNGLKRASPGPNYIHFPKWLHKSFFDELAAEVRQANGTWMQIRKRNEAFDLAGYIRAACLRLGADKIRNWDKAPPWAKPLFENPEIMVSEDRREMKANTLIEQAPAVPVPMPVVRRARVSSYLG